MNKLPQETRIQILQMLCEGSSMRSISKIAGVSINTVTKLLVDAGQTCAAYHDEKVKGLNTKRIQTNEIWSFCFAKQKSGGNLNYPIARDVWTWTAIDAETKLIISYKVGGLDSYSASLLMDDLRKRLKNRVQIIIDRHNPDLGTIEESIGGNIDFAQVVKIYGPSADSNGVKKTLVSRNPDNDQINASYVEKANFSTRMGIHFFPHITNAPSKKMENYCYALALYFMFYNFVRIPKNLQVSPAMAAGITNQLWKMVNLEKMIDKYQA